VPQVEWVDGRAVLLFCCLRGELARRRRTAGATGGVWTATGDSRLAPFDPAQAVPLIDDSLYSGRIVRDPAGDWQLLASRDDDGRGGFVGELGDPIPVAAAGGPPRRPGRRGGPPPVGGAARHLLE
jgi:beta-fructofuranosidase